MTTPASPAPPKSAPSSASSRWLILGALMTCLFLSALDQTIVATALPTIVGDLGGFDQISWVVTAYLLSSTVAVPLFGKISDIVGRKAIIQTTIVVFVGGSMLAGLAQSMPQLIVARGVQGVGGGGILAMTFTILGDIMSPRERSRYVSYFTGVFASASVIGPLAGGYLVDHASWRWVFFINLPLGAVSFAVNARYLDVPKPTTRRPIDFVGAALLTIGVVAILLAMTWGGHEYAWGSSTILALVVIGGVTGVLFVLHERRTEEPILPMQMFHNRVFVVCISIGALLSAVMITASTFLPLYLQVVKGASATSSGLLLVPMMAGVVSGSYVCGRVVNRTGRYKIFPILGIGATIVGMVGLSMLTVGTSRTLVSVGMGIVGLGIGCAMPITTLAVQNASSPDDMGAATSSVNFFRTLGSAFGVALFGTLLTTRLNNTLASLLPDGTAFDASLLNSPAEIRKLPAVEYDAVAAGLADGVSTVFLFAVPILVLAFVLAWMLEEVPLRGPVSATESLLEGAEQ